MPTDGVKVAAKIGYCPEVWSEHLEDMYKKLYSTSSGFAPGQKLTPPYPSAYSSGLNAYKSVLNEVSNPDSPLGKAAAMFIMDTYIRVRKQTEMVEFKRKGIGFIQQSSCWPASMDSEKNRISDIRGTMHPQHGMHAYQMLDCNKNGELVLGNTWGFDWGDEGAKTISVAAQEKLLADKNTICFVKTDMKFKDKKRVKARKIPIKAEDWV
jgi:hypothetical protein